MCPGRTIPALFHLVRCEARPGMVRPPPDVPQPDPRTRAKRNAPPSRSRGGRVRTTGCPETTGPDERRADSSAEARRPAAEILDRSRRSANRLLSIRASGKTLSRHFWGKSDRRRSSIDAKGASTLRTRPGIANSAQYPPGVYLSNDWPVNVFSWISSFRMASQLHSNATGLADGKRITHARHRPDHSHSR